MDETTVESWEACLAKIKEIEEFRANLFDQKSTYISGLLYRGQGNTKWPLNTTLERYSGEDLSVESYYRKAAVTKAQIETLTDKTWNIPTFPEFRKWLAKADMFMKEKLPGYEYMIYLRHHGFPSPLLDWTRSPFVAAYFAFNNIPPAADHVALYVFLEQVGEGKSHEGSKPLISSLGPYVTTHSRHWLQQSQYSICTIKKGGDLYYSSHEDVFFEGTPSQDILWKINIPAQESIKALYDLDKMNINAFSLFGSEESLMETVALREFHLRKCFP